MATRGRRSSAADEVLNAKITARPDAPKDLTKFQKSEWKAIVDRMPADWFTRETHGLLRQYLVHAENSTKLTTLVNEYNVDLVITPDGIEMFEKLTKMLEREGRAMSSLATRLRLTQQSRYNPATANVASTKAGVAKKPWEYE